MVDDAAAGLAVCLAMWFRRRWPVALGLATLIPEIFALSAGVGALLSVLVVAMYRRTQLAVTVAVLHQIVIFAYYPRWSTQYPFWVVWLWWNASRPSSTCWPSRRGGPNGPGSRGRCMTWSRTGCR